MADESSLPLEVPRPIRRTVALLVVKIIIILFFVDTLYATLLLLNATGYVPLSLVGMFSTLLWIIYTVKFVFLAYYIGRIIIEWMSTLFYVTGGHLIRQTGTFNTVETVFQLTDIDSVVMKQSWLGRLLNFGDVVLVFLIGNDQERVMLYAITSPQLYENIFSQFI